LKHALDLSPSLIFYSTCSIFREENEENIKILKEGGYIPVKLEGNSVKVSEKLGFRMWPHKDDTQGFFFSILAKRELIS